MKKAIISSVIFVIIFAFSISVQATTETELANKLYAIGSRYGATAADKVKIERYLADNDVTSDEADAIIAKAQEAAAIMDQAGVTDPRKLPADKKEKLKSIANQAASIIGATLVFTHDGVAVYKNGKLIDVVSIGAGVATTTTKTTTTTTTTANTSAGLTQRKKLAYTGGNFKGIAIGGAIAGIALITVLIRKKVVNA